MAKTMMISNDVYEELKRIKNGLSFSETIRNLIKNRKQKTGSSIRSCIGLLPKDDKEFEKSKKH